MKNRIITGLALVMLAALVTMMGCAGARAARPSGATPQMGQTALPPLRVHKVPTQPVEVTEILWNGIPVAPGTALPDGGDWIANLSVKFKNIGTQPVSFVRIMLSNGKGRASTSLALVFGHEGVGDDSTPVVEPDAFGIAVSDRVMLGSTTATGNLVMQVNTVIWNRDDSIIWSAGELWKKETIQGGRRYKKVVPTVVPQARKGSPQSKAGAFVKVGMNSPAPAVRPLSAPCIEEPCGTYEVFCDKHVTDYPVHMCSFSGCSVDTPCVYSTCHPEGTYPTNQILTCKTTKATFSSLGEDLAIEGYRVQACKDTLPVAGCTPNPYCYMYNDVNTLAANAVSWPDTNCLPTNTPIILDVNGEGVSLTSPAQGSAFDLNVNGTREYVAWTQRGGDDAFLVLDRNGDGKINNGTELFGDHTAQPATWNPNGFHALKVFDSNGDGLIDAKDFAFSQLRLWNDANGSGLTDAGELTTLSDNGLTSISVNYKTNSRIDRYGNAFRYRAKVGGLRGQPFAYDVILKAASNPKS